MYILTVYWITLFIHLGTLYGHLRLLQTENRLWTGKTHERDRPRSNKVRGIDEGSIRSSYRNNGKLQLYVVGLRSGLGAYYCLFRSEFPQ